MDLSIPARSLITSSFPPMQIVYSRSGKPRVVVDLSFPVGSSVNDGIPKDTYLGEPFTLRLPGVDAFVDSALAVGYSRRI